MEPGITGLADVRGETGDLLRANKRNCTRICPRPPARARALTFDLHGDRLAASRFLFAGRHYGDYDLIDVWRCKIIIGSAGEQRYREIGKTRGCPLS